MKALEIREIADKVNDEKDAKAKAEMLFYLDDVIYPTAKALAKLGKYSGDFVLPHSSQRAWTASAIIAELSANEFVAKYNARHNLLHLDW